MFEGKHACSVMRDISVSTIITVKTDERSEDDIKVNYLPQFEYDYSNLFITLNPATCSYQTADASCQTADTFEKDIAYLDVLVENELQSLICNSMDCESRGVIVPALKASRAGVAIFYDSQIVMNRTDQQTIYLAKQRIKAILKEDKYCGFCIVNGESQQVFRTHTIRSKGPNSIVECPNLRNYVCPICSSTGDNAHTISYCPQNNNKNDIVSRRMLRTTHDSVGYRMSRINTK